MSSCLQRIGASSRVATSRQVGVKLPWGCLVRQMGIHSPIDGKNSAQLGHNFSKAKLAASCGEVCLSSVTVQVIHKFFNFLTVVDAVLFSARTSANRDCQSILHQRIQRPHLVMAVSLYSDRLKRPLFADVTL